MSGIVMAFFALLVACFRIFVFLIYHKLQASPPSHGETMLASLLGYGGCCRSAGRSVALYGLLRFILQHGISPYDPLGYSFEDFYCVRYDDRSYASRGLRGEYCFLG